MSLVSSDWDGGSDGPSMAPEYAGWDKPPHAYATLPEKPHFSQQDFNFKKGVCMTESRRKKVEPASTGDVDASTSASEFFDHKREALLKKQMVNHVRTDEVTMRELIQPGDREDAESTWGAARRPQSVPHWSLRAYELKKKRHDVSVHKTPRVAQTDGMVSSSQRAYQNPRNARSNCDGHPYSRDSHAHLALAKRRHNVYLKQDECEHRSIHPPQKSPLPHFYASPEPSHMACYLYPEGPSVTARHCPEHFVSNVVYDSEPKSARGHGRRGTSVDSRSSRSSGIRIMDGTRQAPLSEFILQKHEAMTEDKTPTVATGWTATTASSGKKIYIQVPDHNPQSEVLLEPPHRPEPPGHHFLASPGKPPGVEERLPEHGHVYKSQAQLQYDKMLCQALAYRSNAAKWERTAAGSVGSKSESGRSSCVSASFADSQSYVSQSYVSGRAEREGARTERRSRSADGVQTMRSRSTDRMTSSRMRQAQRAASSDRFARTPGRPAPRTSGSDTRRSRRSP